MTSQGTSTIVQYVREGDRVSAYYVQRAWHRGAFIETARWLVPGGIGALRRETTVHGLASGPLGYGRADLIEAGLVKPSLHMFASHPFLALNP